MGIVKLQQAGEAVTWHIAKAEVVAGKFGPQIKFENEDGDCIFISQETATRQLDRIPLTVEGAVGETLTISRDPNKSGGAPYWGIRLADVVDRSQPAVSKRLPPPSRQPLPFDEESFPPEQEVMDPTPPRPTGEAQRVAPNTAKRAVILDDYMALIRHVAQHSGLQDEQAIQSAAATVFIAWKNAGVA